MKKVLLSLVATVACIGMNANAKDVAPILTQFGYGTGVSVTNVCLEADGVTLNGGTTDYCSEWKSVGKGREICAKSETVELKTSINQTEEVCDKWAPRDTHCLESHMQPYQISLNYTIDEVEYRPGANGGHDVVVAEKNFTIPNCAQ